VDGDRDWFALSLVAGATYTLETVSLASDVDTRMFLYAPDDLSNPLVMNDDRSEGDLSSMVSFSPATSGTYIVMVRGWYALGETSSSSGSSNTYTIQTRIIGGCNLGEPDNTRATARSLALGAIETHALCTSGDQDWVKLDLVGGNTYLVQTFNLAADVTTSILAYDTGGYAVDLPADVDPTSGTEIYFRPNTSGTYYFRVTDSASAFGSGNTYDLHVELWIVCRDLAVEPNNTRATARTFSLGETEDYAFCFNSDQDWVELILVGGNTYTIETLDLAPGVTTGILATDSGGYNVALPADQDSSSATRIQFRPNVSGVYFFRVSDAASAVGSDHNYGLRIALATTCADLGYEPDNSQATARTYTLGATETHAFCFNGDQDWLKLSLVGGNTYTIKTFTLAAGVATSVLAYDAGGYSVALPADANTGAPSLIRFRPNTSGVYSFRFTDSASAVASANSYKLQISLTTTCPDLAYEPDNTGATARTVSLGATEKHGFCFNSDQDWVKLDLLGGNTYTIETLNLAATVRTAVQAFDSGGYSVALPADENSGNETRIRFRPNASGTYFFHVTDAASAVGSANRYNLRISLWAACPDLSYEPDNTRAAARTIQLGITETHGFCFDSDQDWVKLDMIGGNIYTLETLNLAASVTTAVLAFDSGGYSIALPADEDSGAASLIRFQPAVSGTYFFRLTDSASAVGSANRYDLRVTVSEPTSTVPTTTASISPASTTGWNKGNVAVTLSAADNPGGTGVASLTYSATGAQAIAATLVNGSVATFSITATGTTSIVFSATDVAGNVESTQIVVVRIDRTRPTSTAPTVAFMTGALYSTTSPTLSVVWNGADTGGSRLAGFQLERKTGTGRWIKVNLANPLLKRVTLSFQPGKTYWLRVRSTDGAET